LPAENSNTLSLICGSAIHIEKTLDDINSILCKSSSINISKTNKRRKKILKREWFGEDLNTLKRDLIILGKTVAKDYTNPYLRGKFFLLKKYFKKACIRKRNEFRQSILDRLENLEKSNPKEYWNLFNKLKSEKKSGQGGDNISETEWIKHYTKLLGPKEYDPLILARIEERIKVLRNEPYFSELDFRISDEEILQAIKSLKKDKAVGIDHISGEMIIASGNLLSQTYSKLFNSILCLSYYPKAWKIGVLTNLFKTGDPSQTDNYRGLMINSCLAKVFNTIINSRVTKFLCDNKKICYEQIGFKRKARTSDHLFVINVLLQKYTKSKQKLYLCFVDLKKAYDSVWRRALLLKTLEIGIRGSLFKLIENMYSDGEASIKIYGCLSKTFSCDTGVRQGDVLSPNLFNVFINDLPKCFDTNQFAPVIGMKPINCLMYADDLVIMSLSLDDLQMQVTIKILSGYRPSSPLTAALEAFEWVPNNIFIYRNFASAISQRVNYQLFPRSPFHSFFFLNTCICLFLVT